MTNKKKPKVEFHIICPHCKKKAVVRQFEETLKKAVSAEKKIWTTVEKDTQKKLPMETGQK